MNFKKQSIKALLTAGLTLAGCETPNPTAGFDSKAPLSSLKSKREADPMVLQTFQLLKEERYSEASKLLNMTLQNKPKSAIFHLLNGLTYEKLAAKGDEAATELAIIGYQNALSIDPSNVFAMIQLGKLKYKAQEYAQAQEHFANALLIKPNDPILMHEFAAASYYAYDLKAVYAAIQKAEKLTPEDPLVHRSAAMICAALGDMEAAKKHLAFFQSKVGKDSEVDHVTSRLNDWASLYNNKKVTLAADGGNAPDSMDEATQVLTKSWGGGGGGGSNAAPAAAGPAPAEPPPIQQIILDCYLLSILDTTQTSKGNNILENLAITLSPGGFFNYNGSIWGSGALPLAPGATTGGSSVVGTSGTGFGVTPNTTVQSIIPNPGPIVPQGIATTLSAQGSVTGQIFSAGISWAGLTYSLNIANAADQRTELLSRPSLITFLQKPSIFFSGTELVTGLAGQYGGNLVKYPIGTSIEVTPVAIEGDLVTLNIGIENSVATPTSPLSLASTVDVDKTRVDSFAKMRLGETLMLGGIYVRGDFYSKSQFPGLGDVPLLQYFFSNESTLTYRQSIVFMLTPRSPDAVKSAVNRAMTRGVDQPHYRELRSRHPDWFHPSPNAINIFHYLALEPSIYYEFRTGDIIPPSWGWEATMPDTLGQLQSFLYF